MPPLSKGVAGGLRRWSGSSNTGAEESTEEAAKAGDLAAGYTAFQEAAKEAIDGSQQHISEAFVELIGANGLDDEAMEQQLKVLQGTFERLLRRIHDAGKDLQDKDKDISRKMLKAQSVTHQLKLETARTASEVAINNQKAEMEATHHRALELKVQEIDDSQGDLLKEAHEKQEELQKQLNGLTIQNQSTTETLKTTQKLLRAEEGKVKKLEKDCVKWEEDAKQATAQLNNALRDLEGFKDENKSLGERINDLVRAFEDAKRTRDELQGALAAKDAEHQGALAAKDAEHQATLDSAGAAGATKIKELEQQLKAAEDERTYLMGKLQEAQSEAERASVMHAEECRRLTQTLAAKLKQEILDAQKGEREAAEAQLARLLADLKAMGEARSRDEQTISQLRSEIAKREEMLNAKIEEFDAFKVKATKGSNADLFRAREQVAQLQEEIAAVKGDLHKTLSDLNIKTEENMTLGEKVQQLVHKYEQAEADIAQSKGALTKALADLNLTTEENLTLGEQVKRLVQQHDDAKHDIKSSKAMLESALSDLNLSKDQNKTLGQQIKDLVSQFQEARREIADSKASLQAALGDLQLSNAMNRSLDARNKTLGEQIKDMIDEFNAARSEVSDCRGLLEDALAQLNVQLPVEKPLAGHLSDLLNRIQELKDARSVQARRLEKAKQEIERSHKECEELKREIKKIRHALADAMASIGALNSQVADLKLDKVDLAAQIKDFVRRYKMTTEELGKASKELSVAVSAMDAAIQEKDIVTSKAYEKVKEIKEESARERNYLVNSALTSMQALRSHMTYTLSGVRVQQPAEDEADDQLSFISWKPPQRWGTAPNASSSRQRNSRSKNALMVRLVTPKVPPLSARPVPTSSPPTSPRTQRRTTRAATAPDGTLGNAPKDRVAAWSSTGPLLPLPSMAAPH